MKAFLSPGTRSLPVLCLVFKLMQNSDVSLPPEELGKHSWTQSCRGAPSLSLSTPPLASAHATSFRNARLSAGVYRAGFPSWEEDVGNVIKEKKKNSRIEIYPLVTQVELWFRFFPPNNFQKSLKKKKKNPGGVPKDSSAQNGVV